MADREAMERAVIGALKSAIKDHGPITKDRITSAAKRVLGNLANVSTEPVQCTCGPGHLGFLHTVSCPLAGTDGRLQPDVAPGGSVSTEPTDGGVLVRWQQPCASADLMIHILRADSADGPFNVIAMTANGRSFLDRTGKPRHFYRIRAVTPSGPVSLCAHDQLRAVGVRAIEVIGLMRPQDRALIVEAHGALTRIKEANDAMRRAVGVPVAGYSDAIDLLLAKLEQALK